MAHRPPRQWLCAQDIRRRRRGAGALTLTFPNPNPNPNPYPNPNLNPKPNPSPNPNPNPNPNPTPNPNPDPDQVPERGSKRFMSITRDEDGVCLRHTSSAYSWTQLGGKLVSK